MAEVIRRAKPAKPKPEAEKPKVPIGLLLPRDFRVPEENKGLLQGFGVTGAIAVVVLVILGFFAAKLPAPASTVVTAFLFLYVLAPFLYLIVRGSFETVAWKKLLSQPLPFPSERTNPQQIATQISKLLWLPREIETILVPGKPALLTIGNTLIMTEGLYQATSDRDLQILLLHEITHTFAGHTLLLPYARAVPRGETNAILRMIMATGLPLFSALEQWMVWCDVTADRFVLLVKMSVDQAILGVIKETTLMSPDSESRRHLLRFLIDADGIVDRGEQFMITTEINSLLHAHPEAETRIANIRVWREAEAFNEAAKLLRESVEKRSEAGA